jgi:effector-binding domain-containing protein
MVGHCHLREAVRLFRIDRIQQIALLRDGFKQPADFDIHGYLSAGFSYDSQVRVRMQFKPEAKSIALHNLTIWESAEEQPDGSVIVKVSTKNESGERMNMEIEVNIKETAPATVAFIMRKGPFKQMPESFGILYGWIGQKGFVPSGPPSGVYFNAGGTIPEDELMWEVRSPIAGELPEIAPNEQGLGVKRVDSQMVASTVYQGPYEKVHPVYQSLMAWIPKNGYEIAGPPEEIYLTDPSETPPEKLLTEIRFPITKIA